MNIDANLLDDDTKNELASNWFSLTLHANSRSVQSTFDHCFDIWIDSDNQIQTSDLYTYPD